MYFPNSSKDPPGFEGMYAQGFGGSMVQSMIYNINITDSIETTLFLKRAVERICAEGSLGDDCGLWGARWRRDTYRSLWKKT
jgi:hypothetical protein